MTAPVFPTARRYYLAKVYTSKVAGEVGAQAVWQGKQAAEPGTALPATIPHQADLAALVPSFTTVEDLAGSSVAELTRVGLSRVKAQAVITALG